MYREMGAKRAVCQPSPSHAPPSWPTGRVGPDRVSRNTSCGRTWRHSAMVLGIWAICCLTKSYLRVVSSMPWSHARILDFAAGVIVGNGRWEGDMEGLFGRRRQSDACRTDPRIQQAQPQLFRASHTKERRQPPRSGDALLKVSRTHVHLPRRKPPENGAGRPNHHPQSYYPARYIFVSITYL